jgi:hypothetical protein
MKKKVLSLSVTLAACLLISGCGKPTLDGKYYETSVSFLQFNPDGHWASYDGGGGTYSINGKSLMLNSPLMSVTGEIKDSRTIEMNMPTDSGIMKKIVLKKK